jgi:hypothetical protein
VSRVPTWRPPDPCCPPPGIGNHTHLAALQARVRPTSYCTCPFAPRAMRLRLSPRPVAWSRRRCARSGGVLQPFAPVQSRRHLPSQTGRPKTLVRGNRGDCRLTHPARQVRAMLCRTVPRWSRSAAAHWECVKRCAQEVVASEERWGAAEKGLCSSYPLSVVMLRNDPGLDQA